MTAPEINRRLAKALGWAADDTSWYGDPGLQIPAGTWRDKDGNDMAPMYGLNPFSPATNSNDLREYVLPEIRRRCLSRTFESELSTMRIWNHEDGSDSLDVLTAEPRVLALAALRVLEGTT